MCEFPPSCRHLPIPLFSRNLAFCQGGIRHFLEKKPGRFSCKRPAFFKNVSSLYPHAGRSLLMRNYLQFSLRKVLHFLYKMQDSCLSCRRNLTVPHAEILLFLRRKSRLFTTGPFLPFLMQKTWRLFLRQEATRSSCMLHAFTMYHAEILHFLIQ